jgi:hypothetical protein
MVRYLEQLETKTVALLIVSSHPPIDGAVALGLDRQRAAEAAARDIAVANDKLPVFEHEGCCAKHSRAILPIFVYGNVRHRTRVKTAAICQAK